MVNEKKNKQTNTGRTHWKPGQHPWNYGLKAETDERVAKNIINSVNTRNELFKEGKLKSWNRNLTKETDERINEYYSINRLGNKNPMFGKHPTDETKKKRNI